MTSQLRLSRGSVQFQYLQGQKLLFSEINQPCASLQANEEPAGGAARPPPARRMASPRSPSAAQVKSWEQLATTVGRHVEG